MPDTVTVPFDGDVLTLANMTREEFIDKAHFSVAATLWMDGLISAGQAAAMCGLEKVAFLHELPLHGFPMTNIRVDDLEDEFRFARRGTGQ